MRKTMLEGGCMVTTHVHDVHECDEHEHHPDVPGHVHDIHECDEHEHHA